MLYNIYLCKFNKLAELQSTTFQNCIVFILNAIFDRSSYPKIEVLPRLNYVESIDWSLNPSQNKLWIVQKTKRVWRKRAPQVQDERRFRTSEGRDVIKITMAAAGHWIFVRGTGFELSQRGVIAVTWFRHLRHGFVRYSYFSSVSEKKFGWLQSVR